MFVLSPFSASLPLNPYNFGAQSLQLALSSYNLALNSNNLALKCALSLCKSVYYTYIKLAFFPRTTSFQSMKTNKKFYFMSLFFILLLPTILISSLSLPFSINMSFFGSESASYARDGWDTEIISSFVRTAAVVIFLSFDFFVLLWLWCG